MKELPCKNCSQTFFSKLRIDRQQYAQFCSRICFHNFLNKKLIKNQCLHCKSEFETRAVRLKSGRGKYCSKACYDKSKVGMVGYWAGKVRSTPWMVGSNSYAYGKAPWNKGRKSPETSGENNHRWIADRTKLKTDRKQAYDGRYKDWIKQVRIRDEGRCRIGNIDCCGRLETHHILSWRDHPELRYDVNNGITLCHYHHPRKWQEEQKMVAVFHGILQANAV